MAAIRSAIPRVGRFHRAQIRASGWEPLRPGLRQLASAFVTTHQRTPENLRRWFLDEPVHQGDQTWVLSKQWGTQTEAVLEALAKLAPGFEFHADGVPPESPAT